MAVLLVVGCGREVAATPDVVLRGFESQDFDRDLYVADAGEVTIEYVNDARDRHTLLLEGRPEVDIDVRGQGTTALVTLMLEPGQYVLYCNVPGHRENGMIAVLEVQAP